MADIRTAYDLRSAYRAKQPNGHFFDEDTLRFFGERMSEMRLLKGTCTVTDISGRERTCYCLSSLQRKCPLGPRRKYHYFDIETLDDVVLM